MTSKTDTIPLALILRGVETKMKFTFFTLILVIFFVSCARKVDVAPKKIDTVTVVPPAALDTLQLQARPADSLLKTRIR